MPRCLVCSDHSDRLRAAQGVPSERSEDGLIFSGPGGARLNTGGPAPSPPFSIREEKNENENFRQNKTGPVRSPYKMMWFIIPPNG